MFGFVQSYGNQLRKFRPKTRSNELISPNISEHVRTLFVLFVCPTTEHSLPLSIERKNCSWDRLGGRKKEDCVPLPLALSGVEPPQTFLEFFLEFLGPANGGQREPLGARFGFMESKKPRCGDPRTQRPMKGRERLRPVWLGSGLYPSGPHSNSMGDLLCEEQGPFKEGRERKLVKGNQGQCGSCSSQGERHQARATLKPTIEAAHPPTPCQGRRHPQDRPDPVVVTSLVLRLSGNGGI